MPSSTGTGMSGRGPAAPFPRRHQSRTCAPSPCIPVVPGWALLLPHGRARLSCEAIPAGALACELRGDTSGTPLPDTALAELPPADQHSQPMDISASPRTFPALSLCPRHAQVPVPGCSSAQDANRLQRAPAACSALFQKQSHRPRAAALPSQVSSPR